MISNCHLWRTERGKVKEIPTSPFYHRIVFFEGLDKTGKTPLSRRVRFEAWPPHPCMTMDRGVLGRMMFWEFNQEIGFPIEEWSSSLVLLAERDMAAIVWLRAKYDVLARRHINAGEPIPETAVLRQQDAIYCRLIDAYRKVKIPILEHWTDRHTEDESVETILRWMGFSWRNPKCK